VEVVSRISLAFRRFGQVSALRACSGLAVARGLLASQTLRDGFPSHQNVTTKEVVLVCCPRGVDAVCVGVSGHIASRRGPGGCGRSLLGVSLR